MGEEQTASKYGLLGDFKDRGGKSSRREIPIERTLRERTSVPAQRLLSHPNKGLRLKKRGEMRTEEKRRKKKDPMVL